MENFHDKLDTFTEDLERLTESDIYNETPLYKRLSETLDLIDSIHLSKSDDVPTKPKPHLWLV